jgi:signal transduction histidine kinase
MYSCYITLGNSLTGLNNFEKAIEYYQKAVYKSNDLKSNSYHKILKASAYNYIALIYQNKKQYNKSMQFAIEALKFDNFKKIESKLFCYLTNNLAYSKFKLGDKSSLNQFQETLKIGDSIKSIPIIITSKTYLGEYYLTEKDTLKANFYLKDAQLQAHKNNIYEDELKILQLLAEANPVKESFYNNRYIQLNDSLQNVERATRDKFARIEFETAEITTQKNIVEKENVLLEKRFWWFGSLCILILLIIYFIYKNLLLKSKRKEFLLIEEQKKAEAEIFQLMITQQNKFEEGKNSEKQRISLEIHDNVLAKLAAIKANIELQMLLSGFENNEKFNKILDELQNVQKEARNVAHDLHKNMFTNNSSFLEVVRELTTNINNYTAIHFTIEASPNVNWDNVNNTIKINLYRIIQEALHNIEKYAEANKVSIEIDQNENILTVNIIDDGKGFDSTTNKEGIGLKNMKTRMDSLNGLVIITSAVKKGTKINLTVPI